MAVFSNWGSDTGSATFNPWSKNATLQEDSIANEQAMPTDSPQNLEYFERDSVSKVAGDQYEDVAFDPLQFAQGFAKKIAQGYGAVKEAGLGAAGTAMNQLPDRFNLFARYMTGVGNRNLQLDPSTLTDLRRATEQTPPIVSLGQKNIKGIGQVNVAAPMYGPFFPTTGPVNPYYTGAPKSVTNTLGRYTANVNPSANIIEFKDTYDMTNFSENPNLTSGKIQPQKAWNEIESIWNPVAGMRNSPKPFFPLSPRQTNPSYNSKTALDTAKMSSTSSTFSPATRMARALMYVTPWKPTPFNIDITVPMRGEIK